MRILRVLSTVAIAVACVTANADAKSLQSALERWESFGPDATLEGVLSCAREIRERAPQGDASVVARLTEIATRDSQKSVAPQIAFNVACELADAKSAPLIFDALDSVYDRAVATRAGGSQEEIRHAWTHWEILCWSVIADGSTHLMEVMESDERLLELVLRFHGVPLRLGRQSSKCMELVEKCDVPYDAREKALLELLEVRNDRWDRIPESLIDMLRPSGIAVLRDRLRAAIANGDVDYSAAHALAYLADTEIIPDLEVVIRRLEGEGDPYDWVFRIKTLIWRIQSTKNPELLLDRIRDPDPPRLQGLRHEDVTRALEYGVDPARIRAAILENAKRAKGRKQKSTVKLLVREALSRGILDVSELDDLGLPHVKFKPAEN